MTWTRESAQYELLFIRRIVPRDPGSLFNNDHECFMRYCNMQARSISRAGFPEIAEELRTHINRDA